MDNQTLEAKTIETYDNTAATWAQTHNMVNDWEWAAQTLKKLLPAGEIIEIGCGGGRDAAELIKQGYVYTGTDASQGMVQVATAEVPNGTFQQLNVYDLPRLQKQFDGFWACAVLLHVPKTKIDQAMQALHAVLKPGAMGMISIKDGDKEEFEVRDKDGEHEERLFVYWTKDAFADVLTRNSFTVLDYVYKPVSKRTNWHVFFVQKHG